MAQERASSLRLSEVTIQRFRVFGAATVVSLAGSGGRASPTVVLQGENGAGKSSVVAALDQFFRATVACLAAGASGSSDAELLARWDQITSVGHRDLLLRRRDRPAGEQGATRLEARFEDGEIGTLRVDIEPEGEGARVKLTQSAQGKNFFEPDRATCEALLPRIEQPYGPASRPMAAMTARRRALWLPEEAPAHPLPSGLSVQLFRMRTSLDPADRRRWRMFLDVLSRFDSFAGKEVSIEQLSGGPPQLLVEDPERSVVPLSELGAGEQQVVALAAALLLGRGAILSIEKPEAHLDAKHQRAAQEILEAYAQGGLVDQVILESNSPCFARDTVLRFTRPQGGEPVIERVAQAPAGAAGPAPGQRAPAAARAPGVAAGPRGGLRSAG